MARIGKEIIEQLKENVSLVRLIEASGVVLEKRGRDHVGCCPFHDDQTPSLVVSPEKNLWHCMGACDAGGDVIEWVRRVEGVSFRHAVELLMNDYAPDASLAAQAPVKRSTVQKLEAFDAQETHALAARVIDHYHETLKSNADALAWLERRGLDHPDLIDSFRLGYANRTLGYRLPEKNRKQGAELRGQLQALGFLRESGHEHFAGSIVVPVFDRDGQVVEAYGRKLLDNLRKGTPKHLYLPGPHAGVWNAEGVAGQEEVILCEALIDAMTFWAAGYRYVTASYGTGGFTDDHLKLLWVSGVKRVLIAYDRDEAGDRGAEKVAALLTEHGIDAYRVQFPKGMDANAYACQVKPARESLGVLLRSAEWMGKGRAPRRQIKAKLSLLAMQEVPEGEPVPTPDWDEFFDGERMSDDFDPRGDAPSPVSERSDSEPDQEALASDSIPLAALAQASPIPETRDPVADIAAEVSGHEISFRFGERHWRVRGLARNLSYETLRLNLLVRSGEAFHVDTLDLYAARQRAAYVAQASKELGVGAETVKADLARLLLKLEALQEEQIEAALKPQAAEAPAMSPAEREAALAYLQAPDLIERVAGDIEAAGVVGEGANGLVAYLASVSRKLDRPLAILIQSTSAAGKSALMDTVLSLMPEEERVAYSAMTGQSLYYLGEQSLRHKILAIAEEEGAREASYALKLLQSQGELTIASTGKDATSGKLVTQEYHLEGPVALMLTTTAIDLDEELANRCLVLTINETRAQTRAIHARQRFDETLEGLKAREDRKQLLSLHRNAQRLLEPLQVVNPHATRLTFLDEKTRTRRDHQKYLALIRAITLLHQHQRPRRYLERPGAEPVPYIEATLDDIAIANRLAHSVLGRTLDELPPQTRSLLGLIEDWVKERCREEAIDQASLRFSRREVREATGWGNTQLKVHLGRLEELEYLIVHRGGRGQSFVYELAYAGEGRDGQPFLLGLADMIQDYDGNRSGLSDNQSGLSDREAAPGRAEAGLKSAPCRTDETASDAGQPRDSAECLPLVRQNAVQGRVNGAASYAYASQA